MPIGDLVKDIAPRCLKRETDIPLPANKGTLGWDWKTVMDTGVDLAYSFGASCYVSEVSLTLSDESGITAAEIYCDGICSGRYDAETGKTVSGTLNIPVGVSAAEVIVRLYADLKDIVIDSLCIYGAAGEDPILFPTPSKAVFGEETVVLSDLGGISGADEDAGFAAAHLRSRIEEHYDLSFDGPVSVSVERCADIPAEGFTLTVAAGGITIRASDKRGMLYGCEALFQLFDEKTVPICEISDAPYKELRGFHFGLPPRCELEFAKRFFKYILLPMRYNTLFIEFAGGMRFDSHPEISEAWERDNAAAKAGELPAFPHGDMVAGGALLEKDEVRDLIEYARSLGFEIIPEVQSFGHVQYITRAHPDIAEVAEDEQDEILDTRAADQPPSRFYKHSYCPMNEKSYEIIFDLIDEIVEVARPERYVHMGHDEVYQVGLCPRCKNIPHDELYARHVNRLHDYLARKGYKMAIWSDMLQPTEKHYHTCGAINKIPKDILMLDFIWYFHFDMDLENNILPGGFPVSIGNLYSSHFPRAEARLANVIGGEVSTWCCFDEETLSNRGKFFDVLYTAEMLWNEGYSAHGRRLYSSIIAALIPGIRDEVRNEIVKEGTGITSTSFDIDSDGEVPAALWEACENVTVVDQQIVPVDGCYDRIIFTHTALRNEAHITSTPPKKIGSYLVRYADGTEEEIPVGYGGNISVWTGRYADPMPQQYYRHQGYNAAWLADPVELWADGKTVTLLSYPWTNPHPEKEIVSILCLAEPNAAKIALADITGLKLER